MRDWVEELGFEIVLYAKGYSVIEGNQELEWELATREEAEKIIMDLDMDRRNERNETSSYYDRHDEAMTIDYGYDQERYDRGF